MFLLLVRIISDWSLNFLELRKPTEVWETYKKNLLRCIVGNVGFKSLRLWTFKIKYILVSVALTENIHLFDYYT